MAILNGGYAKYAATAAMITAAPAITNIHFVKNRVLLGVGSLAIAAALLAVEA